MTPMILLDKVSLTYHSMQGETHALREINLQVMPGEFLALVGPSGCGKSTICSLVAGLLRPSGGRVLVDGRPVSGVSPKIGYMLQADHLFPWRTIRDNALLGLEIHKGLTQDAAARVDRLLESYGLTPFARRFPGELSGGMRQRAALIRTLATDPDILLLDEPFSALDYQTRLKLADEVKEAIHKAGKTAILVTHDIGEAISMADRVAVLTRRPASVKLQLDMAKLGPDVSPFLRRQHPEFSRYFQTIWKELDVHV